MAPSPPDPAPLPVAQISVPEPQLRYFGLLHGYSLAGLDRVDEKPGHPAHLLQPQRPSAVPPSPVPSRGHSQRNQHSQSGGGRERAKPELHQRKRTGARHGDDASRTAQKQRRNGGGAEDFESRSFGTGGATRLFNTPEAGERGWRSSEEAYWGEWREGQRDHV